MCVCVCVCMREMSQCGYLYPCALGKPFVMLDSDIFKIYYIAPTSFACFVSCAYTSLNNNNSSSRSNCTVGQQQRQQRHNHHSISHKNHPPPTGARLRQPPLTSPLSVSVFVTLSNSSSLCCPAATAFNALFGRPPSATFCT